MRVGVEAVYLFDLSKLKNEKNSIMNHNSINTAVGILAAESVEGSQLVPGPARQSIHGALSMLRLRCFITHSPGEH